MVDSVKVIIVERNGVDLEDSEELDLGSYVTELVGSAGEDHHAGWGNIISAQVVEITARKQMVVFDELILDGELRIEGKLVIEV